MLNFLRNSRKLINSSAKDTVVCVVVGNESCDLDSAVSTLSLAYFYQQFPTAQQVTNARQFLPVLNIARRDYPLKTEVKHMFQKHAISEDLLTFRDELLGDLLTKSDFILVDHHVSPYAERCVEVYDHRPRDAGANLPINCEIHLELVGSCATLVSEVLLRDATERLPDFTAVCSMLRGTIILDTIDFSTTAQRATAKDHEVCAGIEQLLGDTNEPLPDRAEVYRELYNAVLDISSLTSMQLLQKDLKLISSVDGSIKVALPALRIPLHEFMQRADAADAIKEFAAAQKCQLVLLQTLHVSPDKDVVERELGLVDFGRQDVATELMHQLLESITPALELEEYNVWGDGVVESPVEGRFYRQRNIRATRKHVLPIVKKVINEIAGK